MSRRKLAVLFVLGVQLLTVGAVAAQSAAVSPEPRMGLDWWVGRFYDNVRRVREGEVDLLLIGDSITHGWDRLGKATFDRYYAHRNAVNLGFSGDRTQHVLWRLVHGELLDLRPKVAVVMIGTNNANSDTPNDIAAGIGAIVRTLRATLPETKILLLAIFPRGETADDWRRRINESTNAMIAELDDGEWVHVLDIGDAFLEPNGDLPASIMPDFLHPNERGYEIWAEAMEPTLARLMGEPPVGRD